VTVSTDQNAATSITTGSMTTTGANGDLVISVQSSTSQNITYSNTTSGWAVDVNNTPNATMCAAEGSRYQNPSGALTTTWSVSGAAQDLSASMASFKLAAAGGTVSATRILAIRRGPPLRSGSKRLVSAPLTPTFTEVAPLRAAKLSVPLRARSRILVSALLTPTFAEVAPFRVLKLSVPLRARPRLLRPATAVSATVPATQQRTPVKGPVLRARSRRLIPQALALTFRATTQLVRALRPASVTKGSARSKVAPVPVPLTTVPSTLLLRAPTPPRPLRASSHFRIGVNSLPLGVRAIVVREFSRQATSRARSKSFRAVPMLPFGVPARVLRALLRRASPLRSGTRLIRPATPTLAPGVPPTVHREEL
jgi:hypothetical protein